MDYYKKNSLDYINKTKDVDMSNELNKLLNYIPKNSTILDLGFGSARDSLLLKSLGYDVYCLDPTKEFCDNAENLGINKNRIYNIKAQDMSFKNLFDGIWASASLLHINSTDLVDVLNKIYDSLKDNGYLYASFKYGNFEGNRDDRFYNDMTLDKFKSIIDKTKLKLKESWTQTDKLNRENKWINFIVSK
ncbi:MAG: class I SAM-dependent methyltransferase [Acholeplasmatales bacterium]|nr:class I SAM-dependent methyltransferase [Acholeplasmatales bacterium]